MKFKTKIHVCFCIFSACREDADVVFLVDSSGSIGQANYEKVLDYIKDVLNNVNVEQSTGRALRVGLATYADNVVLRLHLNHQFNTRRSLVNAINFDYTGKAHNASHTKSFIHEKNVAGQFQAWNVLAYILIYLPACLPTYLP